jgi:hypothetical protein
VSALVADEHCVWRVIAVAELAGGASGCPGSRTHQLVLESLTGQRVQRQVKTNRYSAWWTYSGRYPVCSCCGEPAPCRANLVEQVAECELSRMRRFEVRGVCPACGALVTGRQRGVTFPDNLEVPLGPPVTFHLTPRACRLAALDYEQRWLAGDAGRKPIVWCVGVLTPDTDGEWRCSSGRGCFGSQVRHVVTVRD